MDKVKKIGAYHNNVALDKVENLIKLIIIM